MATRKQKAQQARRAQQRRPQQRQPVRGTREGVRQPRRQNENHAPAFDQDAGRRPVHSEQRKKNNRRKREHMRITKAEMRRRRLRRRLVAGLLLVMAIAAGVVLSVTLLFRINKFEFQGADGKPTEDTGSYTQDEILQALEVKQGDNLFSFVPKQQQELLNIKFPLLENIEIRRRMPSTVVLRVKPAEESYCLQTDSGWLVLSQQCKVMAVVGDQPSLPIITGQVAAAPQVGEILVLAEAAPDDTAESGTPQIHSNVATQQQALEQMLKIFKDYDILTEITHLDISNPEQITFGYQDRIRVLVGTLNQLDYKIKFAAHLLQNKEGNALTDTDRGVLDMSIIRSDGTIRPTFKQADPELAIRPDPPAPEDPPADTDVPEEANTDATGTTDEEGAPDEGAAPEEPQPTPTAEPAAPNDDRAA